jgi:predicted DNA-binding protein (UPF0251 family)
LRELFRNLQAWESLFLTEGIEAITGPDGTVYSIFDLRELYDKRRILLTVQRARAIECFLYWDMREQDAAQAMGLGKDTPVAIYATQGLRQLAAAWTDGTVWRDKGADVPGGTDAAEARDVQGAGAVDEHAQAGEPGSAAMVQGGPKLLAARTLPGQQGTGERYAPGPAAQESGAA